MKKRLLKLSSSTAILTIAALQTLPVATAQTAATQDDDRDVVVVTASRREENVQDTPLNIAAVGGAQIEEQGFSEIADVLAYVPGINIVDRGGRQGNPIIVRGLNADPIGPGDGDNSGGGTVATYLGEIPIFVDLKLNDMQRVEVLLGPPCRALAAVRLARRHADLLPPEERHRRTPDFQRTRADPGR